jgi:hypothetical protein
VFRPVPELLYRWARERLENELFWAVRETETGNYHLWWGPCGSLHCWTLGIHQESTGRMVRLSNNGHGGDYWRGEGLTLDLGLTIRLRRKEAP